MPILIILYISDLLLYAVIPVTIVFPNSSIQVNPRRCKCGVTSYYLSINNGTTKFNNLQPSQFHLWWCQVCGHGGLERNSLLALFAYSASFWAEASSAIWRREKYI